MNPEIWGPHAWFFLHTITLSYPENPSETDKKQMYDFFMSLSNIIPCLNCMKHFKAHLNKYPITPFLDNRQLLVSWLVMLHNMVNVSIKKPTMTVDEVMDMYEKRYNRPKFFSVKNVNHLGLMSGVFMVLVVLLIFRKNVYEFVKGLYNKLHRRSINNMVGGNEFIRY